VIVPLPPASPSRFRSPPNQLFGGLHPPQQPHAGITITELLLGLIIVATVSAALFNLTIGQRNYARRAAALNEVDAAISADLGWLGSYAKIWKLAEGPYNVTNAQTLTTSYTRSLALKYSPEAGDCETNLATAFLAAAAAVTTSPSRPYSVPTAPGNTTLALPGDASAYTLTRAIATDGLQNNRLLVTYTLSGSDAPALQRTSSVLIAASSWCP
jgi:hypothetical protein